MHFRTELKSFFLAFLSPPLSNVLVLAAPVAEPTPISLPGRGTTPADLIVRQVWTGPCPTQWMPCMNGLPGCCKPGHTCCPQTLTCCPPPGICGARDCYSMQ
ncbi:hypothetical protein BDZ91DRAFT_739020 [Kalaharituber pfeilii]|nr:hypothetical protein BDZ91DRAFT_739020 [Kalaharituber pfeilii]